MNNTASLPRSQSPKRNATGERLKPGWSVSQVLLGLSVLANYWLISTRASDLWFVISAPEDALLVPQVSLVNTSINSKMMPTNEVVANQSVRMATSLDESNVTKMANTAQAISVMRESSAQANQTVNIMFGLKGGETAFIDEWEVSMKAILLNAPLDANLHIHIVASRNARHAVEGRVKRDFGIEGSHWRNQITITVYNVEERMSEWVALVQAAIRENNRMDHRVTIGGYFRLLAYKILPASVGPVIYLDPDVVVMTNLNEIWKLVDSSKVLQLATRWPCSGFMILNMAKFGRFWEGLNSLPNITHGGDQSLVVDFIKNFPNEVGDLPEQWDGHLGNGFKHSPHKIASKRRYGVGFLHFQGQRKRGETFFQGGILKHCAFKCNTTRNAREPFKRTWGLADYYVKVNWNWLKYYGKSSIGFGQAGYPLRFQVIEPEAENNEAKRPNRKRMTKDLLT